MIRLTLLLGAAALALPAQSAPADPRTQVGRANDAARVQRHLAMVGLPTQLQDIAGFQQEGLADADTLMALMAQDKKVKRGRLTFILLEQIGKAVVVNDVDPSSVRNFLAEKLAQKRG